MFGFELGGGSNTGPNAFRWSISALGLYKDFLVGSLSIPMTALHGRGWMAYMGMAALYLWEGRGEGHYIGVSLLTEVHLGRKRITGLASRKVAGLAS